MGADQVSYHGRFKDEKERYEEIRDSLVAGFKKIGLKPDEYPIVWENHFEIKKDYLELYIYNCFGNWGRALDYIEKDFIESYKDIKVEFGVIEIYGYEVDGDGIIYDGKNVVGGMPKFVSSIMSEYAEVCEEMETEFLLEEIFAYYDDEGIDYDREKLEEMSYEDLQALLEELYAD